MFVTCITLVVGATAGSALAVIAARAFPFSGCVCFVVERGQSDGATCSESDSGGTSFNVRTVTGDCHRHSKQTTGGNVARVRTRLREK